MGLLLMGGGIVALLVGHWIVALVLFALGVCLCDLA